MYTLSSNITISDPTGSNLLQNLPVIDVKIKKSRKTLTNTATITLPRNIKVLGSGQQVNINTIIQRGAKVIIQLGYDGALVTRFTGFVSSVSAEIPVIIECQDTMWTLKQNSITKSWPKGINVQKVVSDIYTDKQQVASLELGGLVAVKQSTAQILDTLKKNALQCYFDPTGTLIVNFADFIVHHNNQIEYNLYTNVAENKLQYKLTTDSLVQVQGISNLDNGQKIQINAGDADGEVHTLNYYNLGKDALQTIVNSEINQLKFNGYRGTFTGFGLPVIEPGDVAVITDPVYPEHNGSYLVQSVDISFGTGGYRHEISPEMKIS